VTSHRRFRDREDSLKYFSWRCEQYFDYQHMPVKVPAGNVVLDYGCGPGHDLVGFVEYSRPSRLVGMDVSAASLSEARERLALPRQPELVGAAFSTSSYLESHERNLVRDIPDLRDRRVCDIGCGMGRAMVLRA
jgi:ubiquinone/menaquinone biosynthesis C-methylase UbiE